MSLRLSESLFLVEEQNEFLGFLPSKRMLSFVLRVWMSHVFINKLLPHSLYRP